MPTLLTFTGKIPTTIHWDLNNNHIVVSYAVKREEETINARIKEGAKPALTSLNHS